MHVARIGEPVIAATNLSAQGSDTLATALLRSEPLCVLTGPPGDGRRAAVDAAIRSADKERVIRLAAPFGGPQGLQGRIALALGLGKAGASGPADLVAALHGAPAASGAMLLAIEDADEMGARALHYLDLLQRLANEATALLQVLLIGRPRLWDNLADAALGDLRARVGTRVSLPGPEEPVDPSVTRAAAELAVVAPEVTAPAITEPGTVETTSDSIEDATGSAASMSEEPPAAPVPSWDPPATETSQRHPPVPALPFGPAPVEPAAFFAHAALWTERQGLRTPAGASRRGLGVARAYAGRHKLGLGIAAAVVVIAGALWQGLAGGGSPPRAAPSLARAFAPSPAPLGRPADPPTVAATTPVTAPAATPTTGPPSPPLSGTAAMPPAPEASHDQAAPRAEAAPALAESVPWARLIAPLMPGSDLSPPPVWAQAAWAAGVSSTPAPAPAAPKIAANLVQAAPVESAPVESAPVESAPIKSAPVETAPVETAPVETAPVETAPVEPAPSPQVAPAPPRPAAPPLVVLADATPLRLVLRVPHDKAARAMMERVTDALRQAGLQVDAVASGPAGGPPLSVGYFFGQDRETAAAVRRALAPLGAIAWGLAAPSAGAPPAPGTVEVSIAAP